MTDIDSLAAALFGSKRAESQEVLTDATTRTYVGAALTDSKDGTVMVDLGGDVTLPDDVDGVSEHSADGIEVSTGPSVRAGDEVVVTLVGGTPLKTPMVTGVAGEGDGQNERIHAIEADYVKATTLEADVADIGFLKADSATIKDLQADTAKVHDLTADQLAAATGYVGELQAGSVSAQDIVAGKATVGELAADHVSVSDFQAEQASIDSLQAATADIDTIRANSAKVQNLTASELEADHATVGSLSTTYATIANLNAANGRITNLESTKANISDLEADYIKADEIEATYMHANMSNSDVAWIENGIIKNGAITSVMINDVSANKLTAGTINGSVINVTNLNADNITTGTINGQRIGEGSLSLDKLSEDVYTEAEVDTIVDGLNDRIDGAIETHTGTAVPTLNNQPASSWNTTKLRDEHVGDVYYVVNSQSQQNGYCYRFTKSGSTYSWQLIKDSDVTAALSRLTTAEGKITTFDSDISKLKTDTGTLTTKTESLETRMSDAESDILDKVDTTTFNEVSDTVDQHSQSISQMSQTLSNKADGSTVTALTNRVSKNEQDISGINTTIGELSTTVESKADGSTVESVSNRLNTVSQTVDGHTQSITNITSTQTTMQGKLDKTIVESTQLWYTKADTAAPSKPTSQVTSTSTSGGAWRTVVPAYSSSYPNYFYCYQWKYSDGTYGWSSVTRDIAMGESQSTSRAAASDASTAKTNASTAVSTANTANTNASNALTKANTADTNASNAVSTANTAAADASTAKTDAASAVSTANTASTNASAAVSTANTAKATADKNVKSSLQLWFTNANETAPNKPTSKVTSTAVSGNGWRTVVPTYSASYPYYFYCYQYELADGTYTWSDVVYDRATTENQSNSRSAVAGVSTLTTKTNTISDTVDGHTQSIGSINSTLETKADSSTVSTLTTKVNTVSDTVDGHTSQLSSITSTQTTMQSTLDKTVKSSIQLWYSKANTTAPSKPTSQVTSTSTNGNAWRIVVPAYNASYPHYYYCWQYEYADGTYGWSAVVRDIAMGESQSTARTADSNASAAVTTANTANTNASTALTTANTANTNASDAKTAAATASTNASEAKTTAETAASDASTAKTTAASAVTTANSASTTATNAQNTANANIKSSVQLWFTKANSTAPNKPTSVVSTSNANTTNAWNLVVPVWNKSYPHYFYCYQQQKGDGNYQWTDVVYDRATSEAQQLANTTSTNLSTLQEDYATYKQTTTENVSSIGTRLTTAEGKISTAETAIGQNTDAIALRATKTEVQQVRPAYASSSTAAGTAAKVATIDPAVTGYALYKGASVAVTFSTANTAATPTLNLNSTGAKQIRSHTGAALSESEYKWAAGATVDLVYDGTYWRMQDGGAVKRVASAEASIKVNADNINLKVSKNDVINQINVSTEGAKIQASKVEIDGTAVFSAISSDVDDAITSKGYQTSSQVNSAITSKGYATTTQAQGYASTAKSEAISAAATDATSKANAAQTAATNAANTATDNKLKSYSTTAQANNLYDAKGAAQTVQNNLDNLEIGGRNLFSDSKALSTAKWAFEQGATRGDNLATLAANANSRIYQLPANGYWSWKPNTEYVVSVEAKASASGGKMAFNMVGAGRNKIETVDLTTSWARYSWAFTSNATVSTASASIYNRTNTGTVQVRLPKLEESNKATDWSPAPEDVAADIAAAQATANSAAPKASAVKRTQRIWYRTNASSAPATPGTASSNWVTKADDGNDAWTKMHVAISSTHKYIYTCEQYEMANGTVGYTSVLLDNTITVIDGGNLITGSVKANTLDAADINASKTLTVGAMTDAAASTILNSNVRVGGRNLFADSKALSTAKWSFDQGATRGDNLATLAANVSSRIYQLSAYGYWSWKPNTEYVVSVEAKASASGGKMTFSMIGAGGNKLKTFDLTTSWARYSWAFTSDATVSTGSASISNSTNTGTVQVRLPKLEEGNKATDWTPAPEDITAEKYITSIDDNGIRVHAKSNTTTNYAAIDADGMDVVKGGVSVAQFGKTSGTGPSARIGKEASAHVTISASEESGTGDSGIGYTDSISDMTLYDATGDNPDLNLYNKSTAWSDGNNSYEVGMALGRDVYASKIRASIYEGEDPSSNLEILTGDLSTSVNSSTFIGSRRHWASDSSKFDKASVETASGAGGGASVQISAMSGNPKVAGTYAGISVEATSAGTVATIEAKEFRLYDNQQDSYSPAYITHGVVNSGQSTATPANGTKDFTVTFGHTYTSPPHVVPGFYSTSTTSALGGLSCAVNSITNTGCTIRVFNNTSSARSPAVEWIAIG